MTKGKSTVTLYWVTTEDHSEDWFVFAHNSRSAAAFHEDYEGYDRGDATATPVVRGIPLTDGENVPRHAHLSDLSPLGFKVLQDGSRRIVQLGHRKFREGSLEATIEALHGLIALKQLRQDAAKRNTGGKLQVVK